MGAIHKAFNTNSKGGVVIRRKLGEAINIGENVRVTYIERRGGMIKLLIDAPRDQVIYRENKEDTEIIINDVIE